MERETEWMMKEWLKCSQDPVYFIDSYVYIYDAARRMWIPFKLWKAQAQTVQTIDANLLTIILKARQLGITWLCLGYALWLLLFKAIADVLLFSRRDDEAVHLLDERLKGMYRRLPAWMQASKILTSNNHVFALSTGSIARAFPTSAGDSYTATLAIVDEADLVPDLNALLRAVKPTIDTGGRMILLSRPDKDVPQSEFKRIYRAARRGEVSWAPIFLPWNVRPSRTQAWYDIQRRDVYARTGSYDDLFEQYPATETEALAPRSLDKRLPSVWLEKVYVAVEPLNAGDSPLHPPVVAAVEGGWEIETFTPHAIPRMRVYANPDPTRKYVFGADPAEGNPSSDDSAFIIMDQLSGEEVCTYSGKMQPSVFAELLAATCKWYGTVIGGYVERNNHGHAVILWMQENSRIAVFAGKDDKEGWQTNVLSKALMYNEVADVIRAGDCIIHDMDTYQHLAGVSGSTLKAPPGELDDLAIAFGLAHIARVKSVNPMMQIIQTAASLYGSRSMLGFENDTTFTGSRI